MWATLRLLALGIVAFVVSLTITAPAQVVARYLPPNIQATGLRGTLWEGQARRMQVRGFNLGAVTWDMQPLALLLGRLQSEVSINQPALQGRGTVAVGINMLRLADTNLAGRAQLLRPFLSGYGVNPDGRVEADIRALQVNERGPQAADGVIVWRGARITSPAQLELGDVNLTLRQEDDTAIADVNNTGDSLRLSGGARVQQGWKYDARLRIEPTPSTPGEVRDTLPMLGQPDASGAITLDQQGTLNSVAASLR